MKIPITLIIGENDSKNNTVAINYLSGEETKDISLEHGLKSINKVLNKPKFKL